jgi:hypothetical protein
MSVSLEILARGVNQIRVVKFDFFQLALIFKMQVVCSLCIVIRPGLFSPRGREIGTSENLFDFGGSAGIRREIVPAGTPERLQPFGRFAKSLILLVELVRIELTTS